MNGIANLWTNLSVNNRILFVLLTIGSLVAVTATYQWAMQSQYTVLYTNLAPEESGEIIDKLSGMGIDYRFSAGGTALMVPASDAQEARVRLASDGFPRGGIMGYEIFDQSNLGMTDFLQKVNFRRALEGEIAKSIMSLSEVVAARVHLVIPEQRLFAKDQNTPTASVVLKLSRPLTPGQVAGIQHLIAASVEGLDPGHIALVDYRGSLLTGAFGGGEDARLSNTQHELLKSVERHLEEKAQSMLDRTLGPGKSVVRVNASLNFDRVETSAENYDPDRVAIRSEEINTAKPGAQGDGENTNGTITNYEISKTVERVVSAYGTIERLSVAVMVDGRYEIPDGADKGTEPVYQPRDANELGQIGALVRTAVGFDSSRSDHMEVVNLAFDTESLQQMQVALDSVTDWSLYMEMGKNVFFGLLILVGFVKVRKLYSTMGNAIRTASKASAATIAAAAGISGASGVAVAGAGGGAGKRPAAVQVGESQTAEEIIDTFAPQRTTASEVFAAQAEGKAEEVAKVIKTLMIND